MISLSKARAKFSSIKIKFTVITVLISLLSYGIAAFLSTQWLSEEIADDYKEKTVLMGTHIIHDLETAMISNNHGGISDVLNIYRNYKGVEELRVFNLKAQEIFFEEISPPESRVKETLETGKPIHFHKEINKKEVVSYVIPIVNKPECHNCHGKSEVLRGAILLSLNQEQMQQYIGQEKQKYFILFGLIAIMVGVATIIAVNRLFLKPLSLIQKGTEAIERGEFQYQIPVKSKDEISILGEKFNRMAQTLRDKKEMLWEQVMLLSRSQKEWQETFDSVTDLIAVIDNDFNIIRANRSFYEYHSLPLFVEINKKCYEIIGTCSKSDCSHKKPLRNITPVADELADPKTGRILQISNFPCYSSDGDFIGSIFVAKDITEKKENEMKLILSERLSALGQMASNIAHEINNPLATIRVCAEGLLNRMKKDAFEPSLFKDYLKMIKEEVMRCNSITTNILSFVRKTSNEKKEIDINGVLDKTLEMISLQDKLREVDVVKIYNEEMLSYHGYEGELRQVFLSIITNALDAMENKGRLILETNMNGGDAMFVNISDTGPGISSNHIGLIFDPFFTTKLEKGGTGLGLSIANKIIKENKGKIEVISEEGKGTTFTITLPL